MADDADQAEATVAAFFQAIRAGDRAQVQRSLAAQPALIAARDPQGVSAPLVALYSGEPDIAELLAEAGAPLDVFAAAALGRVERLSALLAADPALAHAVAADGFSPLGLASFFGQAEAAHRLLEAGADPNRVSQNAMRVAPLHSAVAAQQLAISEDLLRHGADVNATQADDFTPLHEAAQNGQLAMIELLLAHGADPNRFSQNAMRVAPLHSAVAAQHLDISEDLLRQGANVNAAQADDFTPLHEAAQNGQLAMIELLLANGADPSARKSDGQTPLDVAEAHGQTASAELLCRLAGG
jgi:ankyrin repeat protein